MHIYIKQGKSEGKRKNWGWTFSHGKFHNYDIFNFRAPSSAYYIFEDCHKMLKSLQICKTSVICHP